MQMTTMSDQELVTRIREELYFGCVSYAKQFADMIQDYTLRREMLKVIRDYERS